MNSKRSKIILVFLVITSLLVGADLTYAQPKIPKEKIPSDFSSEVKEQIEKLYSKTAVERADAALAIGKMGKNAISAIPFLIAILHDDIPREWTRTMCRGIPYLLNRDFSVDKPNSVWVTDITYIWTFEGWLYLAAIMDLFSRGIVGLTMDKTIADTLTLSALQQAILRRCPPKGLICHSDRGSQYACNDFKALLAEYQIAGSMSKKGDCWDNAVAESFFHTLKVELIHRMRFKTREEAKARIFEYVEMYYNTRRAHSTLGYLSPFDYEKRSLQS
jgi:transposase InsO family protein